MSGNPFVKNNTIISSRIVKLFYWKRNEIANSNSHDTSWAILLLAVMEEFVYHIIDNIAKSMSTNNINLQNNFAILI